MRRLTLGSVQGTRRLIVAEPPEENRDLDDQQVTLGLADIGDLASSTPRARGGRCIKWSYSFIKGHQSSEDVSVALWTTSELRQKTLR